MFKSQFVNFNDRLYILKKIIRQDLNPDVEYWKERLGADTVLLKEGQMYFLEIVPDIDYTETLNN
jgi:hypothetical protein